MALDQPWMWHGGGMWIFPMLMFALILILCFLILGRRDCRTHWCDPSISHREEKEADSALELLKKRYVKEEVTKEEFEQMKKDILG